MGLNETCHLTRCKKRSDRQEKEHKQKVKLEEDVRKARTLDFWGNRAKKAVK